MTDRPSRQPKLTPLQAGETYGLLTVLGEADKRDSRGNKYFHVRCECGVERVVMGGNLRRGVTASCGDRAHAKARTKSPAPVASGERYGKLTTIERVGTSDAGAVLWRCVCDCGGVKTAVAGTLRSGRIVSCGCIRRGGYAEVDYWGAHARVKRKWGKASKHACVDCGVSAAEWSLAKLRVDPDHIHWQALKFRDGSVSEVPYSRDPEDYEPRCTACHMAYDRPGRSPDGKFTGGASGAAGVTDVDRAALAALYEGSK